MFAQNLEEHEGSDRGKPRLPQSQGGRVNVDLSLFNLNKADLGKTLSPLRSTSNKRESNVGNLITISRDLDITMEVATLKDYHRVARTLLIAFENDPFTNHILNTDPELDMFSRKGKRKRDLMLAFYECLVLECFHSGGLIIVMKDNNLESYLTSHQVKAKNLPYLGAACWMRLDFYRNSFDYDYAEYPTFLESVRPSFLKLNVFSSLANCRLRLKEVLPLLVDVRDKTLRNVKAGAAVDKVWYLSDLCIAPSMRGKGLARALVNYCLNSYVDKSPNSWAYLENSNLINRQFYAKMGFVIKSTFYIDGNVKRSDTSKAKGKVPLDAMVRAPPMVTQSDKMNLAMTVMVSQVVSK